MNFITVMALIVSSTFVYSAPLIFTALGGVYSEHSGITNIGLEGIMTMGAFSAIVFNLTFAGTFGTATPWLGALVGGIVGLLFSLLHAVATINFHAANATNEIVAFRRRCRDVGGKYSFRELTSRMSSPLISSWNNISCLLL